MPSLDSITFDTSSLRPGRTEPGKRLWFSPEGDAIELDFFDRPPDIPSGLPNIEALRRFYLGLMGSSPDSLVEVALLNVDGSRAVRVIISGTQPHGQRKYLGGICFPFRDFNYLIKVQCLELHPGTAAASADPDDAELETKFPDHPLARVRAWLKRIEQTCQIDPELKASPPFSLPPAEAEGGI